MSLNMLQNSHDTRRQADIAIDSGSDSVLYKILLASSDATLHNTIQVFFWVLHKGPRTCDSKTYVHVWWSIGG